MENDKGKTAKHLAAMVCVVALTATACGSTGGDETEGAASTPPADTQTEADTELAAEQDVPENDAVAAGVAMSCEEIAGLFVTRGSANPELADPEVSAECAGTDLVVTANAIPDYTYIETSPGDPRVQDLSYTIPSSPTIAEESTAVPLLGAAAVTLSGIPIFGPTEGTGGDVDSLPGIISECGSHNGPTGFHIHKILTSENTDCLFSPEEVAETPQLVGYAFDGFPIYTGIGQFTSSWELSDETLFATDTWAAHSYVEGSGDLDECNGRFDEAGNYAYYTTETFPYVLGCYTGVVDADLSAGGGGRGGPPQDEDR